MPTECTHHEAIAASDAAQWQMIRQLTDTLTAVQQNQAQINERLNVHLAEERARLQAAMTAAENYAKHASRSLPALLQTAIYKALELGIVALLAWAVITAAKALG